MKTAFLVMAFAITCNPNRGLADPPEAIKNISTNQEIGELITDAATSARSGDGVGVVILIGYDLRKSGKPLTYFSHGFERLFQDAGVRSNQFSAYMNSPFSSFEFYTRNNAFGPFDLGAAMTSIVDAAQEYISEESLPPNE